MIEGYHKVIEGNPERFVKVNANQNLENVVEEVPIYHQIFKKFVI